MSPAQSSRDEPQVQGTRLHPSVREAISFLSQPCFLEATAPEQELLGLNPALSPSSCETL